MGQTMECLALEEASVHTVDIASLRSQTDHRMTNKSSLCHAKGPRPTGPG